MNTVNILPLNTLNSSNNPTSPLAYDNSVKKDLLEIPGEILSKYGAVSEQVVERMAEGIRKARGRMFPFGFIKILREGKRSKMLTLYLGAVKEEYRGSGLDALMGIKMLDTAKKEKMAFMDSHLVLETNIRMRREYERLGGVIYKKYRIYRKEL